jgi:hypothetical protein
MIVIEQFNEIVINLLMALKLHSVPAFSLS